MHDDGAREILEVGTEYSDEQVLLDAEVAVPDGAFDQRVGEADDHGGGRALGAEACTFSDAAGNDRGDGSREGGEKEELHERHALRRKGGVAAGDGCGIGEEHHAIRNPVADEEVDDGRDREVDEDFDECVDLVLVPHGADFEKCEAAVHGEDEDSAHQEEEDVCTL